MPPSDVHRVDEHDGTGPCMVSPRDQQKAADNPDEKTGLPGSDAPDLAYPEPPDDARAGTGVFKKSIEGYRDHGARPRLLKRRRTRLCAVPVSQWTLLEVTVLFSPARALTRIGNFSL